MRYKALTCSIIFVLSAAAAMAQVTSRTTQDKCGTMQRLEARLSRNPELRARFEQQREQFNRIVEQNRAVRTGDASKVEAVYTIPVVFHIVLANQSLVTDAQIQAQVDTLNKDYSGTNGDTVNIPSYFKSLFGRSSIRFCLAQRTPDDESTNGIERITTAKTSFSNTDDGVKHASSGGADNWNSANYFNVWICPISNSIVGYATFPQDGSEAEQGVVIDYRSLPGGSFAAYNGGKTLTHEAGHYFNLYHIWGDDDGACTGTDYVDDTPNQANSTSGCPGGIKTDNCTPSGNGILYQDYMDYSNDPCLVMFTSQQAARMESALLLYRPSLLSSNGCQPAVQRNYDAQLLSITQPVQRLCSAQFTPAVTIRNRGVQTLTSLLITAQLDGAAATSFTWTGSLVKSAAAAVTLGNLTAPTGNHTLTITVTQPNSNSDEDQSNNALSASFQYYPPVTAVTEGFENSGFPPTGWDIVNPDNGTTWQRITGVAKTGNASVKIDNFNTTAIGRTDDLRMPTLAVAATVDTAFLSFQVAAAAYTALNTAGNVWDTLEVLASTDCGASYTSLYKKWGSTLVTRTAATTNAFVPAATEWRKDSVNLASYIGAANLLVAFRNTGGNENNVYLDDVNLRTVTVNPYLKAQGFLIAPNPTTGLIAVQFYPQPVNLTAIQVFSITGQKLAEVLTNGQTSNYYGFNLSGYASGTYLVRAVFTDRVIIKRIVKF